MCCLVPVCLLSFLHCVLSFELFSLIGFSPRLSIMVQYFSLTTNQHQPALSAQKPTSEQAGYMGRKSICSLMLLQILGLTSVIKGGQ